MKRLFGTDGIRGIVNKTLTGDLAYKVGLATAKLLTTNHFRDVKSSPFMDEKPIVLIGTDTRPSKDLIFSGIACGLAAGGVNVITVGILPTPAIAYLTKRYKFVSAGIMCTYYIYFQYPLLRAVQMKTFAINHMTEPVLMFDYNDNLQVYNDAAEEMLGVYTYYPMREYIIKNELHYEIEEREKHKKKEREFTRTKIINGKTYLIHGQELWDQKERFVGTFQLKNNSVV